MHKFHLVLLLFLFSPLAAMLNPATPSSDGICHLARLPREIRDRIAKFVLYETDEEFAARALADYRAKKDAPKSQLPKAPGIRNLLALKYSPSKTYQAYLFDPCNNGLELLNICGPLYGEKTKENSSHIYSYAYTYRIAPLLSYPRYSYPRYLAFNKQRTKIFVMNLHETGCMYSLPDFFIEEKYTGSVAENSLKEFFLRKLVCKRLENSLTKRQ